MTKTALVTGINGQDGSYLAELLLKKGYNVYGLIRRQSTPNLDKIKHLTDKVFLVDGDMTDQGSLVRALQISKPDEVYNLAAQSFVGSSFNQPLLTSEINAMGTLKLLEAIRQTCPNTRFYQAGTSEMFGNAPAMQGPDTPFEPRSPYGVSKVFAHYATVNYRESYNIFATNGILFNHESPRRGEEFVTQKIAKGVARIYDRGNSAPKIRLGNLDAKRDWGYAPDFVEAMWKILQHNEPDDFVISTGITYSVREFLQEAFDVAGIKDWERHIVIDPGFMRPAEVNLLCGDYTKAKQVLGWEPKVHFKEIVKIMVEAQINEITKGGLI